MKIPVSFIVLFVLASITFGGSVAMADVVVKGPKLIPVKLIEGQAHALLLTTDATNDLIEITRLYDSVDFDPIESGAVFSHASDGYRYIPFAINDVAEVKVSLARSSGEKIGSLIETDTLNPGTYYFSVYYGQLSELAGRDGLYFLELSAVSGGEGTKVTQRWPLRLSTARRGETLGALLQHEVLIHEGELSLRREDIALHGLGPDLNFIRSYSSREHSDTRDARLSPGWDFNFNIWLSTENQQLANAANNVPDFIINSSHTLRSITNLPQHYSTPTAMQVTNGGFFRRAGQQWQAQKSFHGRLVSDGNSLRYYSKDYTLYDFGELDTRVYRPTIDTAIVTFTPLNDDAGESSPDNAVHLLPYKAFAGMSRLPVKAVKDSNGNALRFHYEQTPVGPLLTSIEDAVDRKMTLTYNHDHSPDSEILDGDVIRLQSVDVTGDVRLVFEYDAANGRLIRFGREDFEELYRYRQAVDDSEKVLLNEYQRAVLNQAVDGLGNVTSYRFHNRKAMLTMAEKFPGIDVDRIIKSIRYPDLAKATIDYEPEHNRRIVTGLRGIKTHYTLNAAGNPVKTETAGRLMSTAQWSQDVGGTDALNVSATDASGNITRYEHDAQGNVIRESVNDADAEVTLWDQQFSAWTAYSYDEDQWQRRTLDDRGNVLLHEYSDGFKVEYEYDDQGLMIRSRNTEGREETLFYDRYGYKTKIFVNGELHETFAYDERGRLLNYQDEQGVSYVNRYDALDRLIEKERDGDVVERYRYDVKSNETYVLGEDGNEFFYTYNRRGLVTHAKRITQEHTQTMSYRYDANSNVISKRDWYGDVFHYEYDSWDKLVPDGFSSEWDAMPLR